MIIKLYEAVALIDTAHYHEQWFNKISNTE